ncbi:nucleotidyltransferase domain-containing protein [Clostridium sp. UBA6640]|uniref:nucleotidyltransferase domain-containing protein n=1 Tax=Clostridium sp. UBA6640 TaxID=1946370 RepID=UPI0025BEAB57|nr:nucleotidyltransferase domain-containing protein [Clostridium sp. UBA6640]
MDSSEINRLKQKNKELINIVIQKVQKEYQDDIDLIGVFGSFFTGDFHEKSDLDLLVVLNNERGWGFSTCFILDGIGYDFYGSTWEKLERSASFDDTFISQIIDVDIVYCREPQYIERFMHLRQNTLNIINSPMTTEILQKAKKHLDNATLTYGKMMLEEEIGAIRQLSGDVISHLTNTVCFLNHSYFKLGVKHYLEEMLAMKRVPKYFEQYFNGVIYATSVLDIKETTTKLIRTVKDLYDEIVEEILEKAVPTKDNLKGTYEEIWSNWKNKIQYAADNKDIFLAFSSGVSCQSFYDLMHRECGTISINLMKHFQANDLKSFADAFEEAMQLYKKDYDKLQLQVLTYDSIDAFRKDYLGLDNL